MCDLSDSSASATVGKPVMAEMAIADAEMTRCTCNASSGPAHTNVAVARFVQNL